MKRTVAFLLLHLSIAAQSARSSNPLECLETAFDPEVDYFPNKAQPAEATSFSIEYHNTYKIVSNIFVNTTYLLYQCGTEVPESVDVAAFDAVLSIPIDRIGISQTPQIPFIEHLGKINNVALFLTDPEYNSSPCLADRIGSGSVWVLRDGQPVIGSLANSTPVEAPPGLVAFMGSFNPSLDSIATQIIVSEYTEKTNRAIFEWLFFYSAFFNDEELANTIVAAVDAEYDCVRESAQSVATDAPRPVVLSVSYSEFCSGWSIGSCPNFYCEFANDAGADLVQVPPGFGSIVGQDACAGVNFLTIDEVIQIGQNATHWFYPSTNWNRTYEAFQEQMNTMKSVQLQQVFDYQGAGVNAWFQDRPAEYYDVFHDFCASIGTCPPYVGPTWFRNVFTGPIGDGEGDCSDRDSRFPFTYERCTFGRDSDGSEDSQPSSTGGRPSALWVAAALLVYALV